MCLSISRQSVLLHSLSIVSSQMSFTLMTLPQYAPKLEMFIISVSRMTCVAVGQRSVMIFQLVCF